MRFNTICYYLSLFVALLLFNVSCRTKDRPVTPTPTPTVAAYGKLNVRMNNQVAGHAITFSTMSNTNANGERYTIDALKYYVSSFTLIKDDNTETNFHNYKLINAEDTATCKFTLDSVANGTYKAVRFYLGIDSAHNYTGLQTGDLDISLGMFWDWNTGYKFFIHQGFFYLDTAHPTELLLYHYGTSACIVPVDIPVTAFTVAGNSHTLSINFDLNTLYSTPTVIRFKDNNVHESLLSDDRMWLAAMKTNFKSAFTFSKID